MLRLGHLNLRPLTTRRPGCVRPGGVRLCVAVVLATAVLVAASGCVSASGSEVEVSQSPTSPTPDAAATPDSSDTSATATPDTSATATPDTEVPAFDPTALSVDDPASLWVVSNKLRPLNPVTYVPSDLVSVPVAHQYDQPLRQVASDALVAMFAAGVAEGAGGMQLQSAYRSYDRQVTVYNGWVSRLGQAQADAQSARPGFSEHQTGLAVDISSVPLSCALSACFGTTPQGIWLAANAWRFGFVLRYPADKVAVTGFTYEPWHFRYVGLELSTEMHTLQVTTLEEFFALPAAPDYAG